MDKPYCDGHGRCFCQPKAKENIDTGKTRRRVRSDKNKTSKRKKKRKKSRILKTSRMNATKDLNGKSTKVFDHPVGVNQLTGY